MREIAIEEVTAEGLLLQMNRTQIFEKDEKGDGRIEECHQGEKQIGVWIDWLEQPIRLSLWQS